RYDVIRPPHVRLRTIAGSNHAAPVSILALPCFRYCVFRNTDCASADITVLAAAPGAIHHSAGSRFGRRHYGSFARRQACREMGPAGRGRESSRRRCFRRHHRGLGAHDDHMLLFAPASTFTAHTLLHEKLPYDPKELTPIARVTNTLI